TGGASMGLLDLHALAGLFFPVLHEQFVVGREQLTGNIIGGIEQLLISRLGLPHRQTSTQHQGSTPAAGSLEQGKTTCHKYSSRCWQQHDSTEGRARSEERRVGKEGK